MGIATVLGRLRRRAATHRRGAKVVIVTLFRRMPCG